MYRATGEMPSLSGEKCLLDGKSGGREGVVSSRRPDLPPYRQRSAAATRASMPSVLAIIPDITTFRRNPWKIAAA